jgi:5-methylcytosine-specific restriction endonuclease McrA
MKRSAMKRGKSKLRRKPKPKVNAAEAMAHRMFREEARRQRCCQNCTSATAEWHPHHVVYEQHVVGAGHPPYDTENSMRLCVDCHRRHHNRAAVIPLSKLSDRHIAYAFRKLGLGAHYYLHQRYAGEDERVEQALATAEAEQE